MIKQLLNLKDFLFPGRRYGWIKFDGHRPPVVGDSITVSVSDEVLVATFEKKHD